MVKTILTVMVHSLKIFIIYDILNIIVSSFVTDGICISCAVSVNARGDH